MVSIASLVALAATVQSFAMAHMIMSYPGYRGNNLISNETFPYGMQWMYPCGGLPTTTNRTKWPVSGGAVAVAPGQNVGHPTAFMYVNLGYGTNPPNMSNPMVPVFEIIGPSRNPWNGSFCLPQVPLPVNATVKVGDNATIQVVELAIHGAALYNCADITFAADDDPEIQPVTPANCYNSSDIQFAQVYAAAGAAPNSSDAPEMHSNIAYIFLPMLAALAINLLG
jgi:hypothetical protein